MTDPHCDERRTRHNEGMSERLYKVSVSIYVMAATREHAVRAAKEAVVEGVLSPKQLAETGADEVTTAVHLPVSPIGYEEAAHGFSFVPNQPKHPGRPEVVDYEPAVDDDEPNVRF